MRKDNTDYARPAPRRGLTRRQVAITLAALAAGTRSRRSAAQGATTEVAYNTFLDPANPNDPRAAAQSRMIEAFEQAHPRIKIKVVVDPSGANGIRALRARSESPDLVRATGYQLPEYVATGAIQPIDEWVARDRVDQTDWLLPFDQMKLRGRLYGLQQDYRIPILIYRKSRLAEAGITPPRTWDEVCAAGGRLTQPNVIGYAIPLGVAGGIGGAQAFQEFLLSSLLAGSQGKFFEDDGRTPGFSRERLVQAAETIRNLFGRCGASSPRSLQYGFNEVQEGLRTGTIASATFGLHRYPTLKRQVGEDIAWVAPPAYAPDDKQASYGFQLCINANSPRKEAAWEFVKFMTGPQAQALQARGGEVVARASAYNDPYLRSAEAQTQREWLSLVRSRGRMVAYSIIQSTFDTIAGEAFQRMVLRNTSAEDVATEIATRYGAALERIR